MSTRGRPSEFWILERPSPRTAPNDEGQMAPDVPHTPSFPRSYPIRHHFPAESTRRVNSERVPRRRQMSLLSSHLSLLPTTVCHARRVTGIPKLSFDLEVTTEMDISRCTPSPRVRRPSKRQRYTRNAWYESFTFASSSNLLTFPDSHQCKRRKVKCSGEPSCQQCSRQGYRCTYSHRSSLEEPSTPFSLR
jgi:hypothetical protein